MDLYPLLVFAHVLGAVGLFAALAIEVLAFSRLQRAATVAQTRSWMALVRDQGRIGPISMATILVTGIIMLVVRWGPQPWLIITLGWMIVTGISTAALTRRPMARLATALEHVAQIPQGIRAEVVSGPLSVSLRLRVAMLVGIVALMTTKPGVAGSLAIVGAAIAIGLAAALRPSRRQAPATT